MPEDMRDYVGQASDDDLAADFLARKDAIRVLREEILHIEGELARRLEANNARLLQGERYRVSTNLKRSIVWSQDHLSDAFAVATAEGRGELFARAFPLKREANLTNLNQLLKFGGKTAEAIEQAKTKEEVRVEYKITDLPS